MKLLLENWRKYLAEETELEEGIGAFVPGSSEWKMNKAVKKLEKELADKKHKSTWERIAQELKETKQAWQLAKEWKTLSDAQKEVLWKQIYDIGKTTALAAAFVAPLGGSIWIPMIMPILKKYNLLPSAFMNENVFYVDVSLLIPSEEMGHGKEHDCPGAECDAIVQQKMDLINQGNLEPIEVCNQKPVNSYRVQDQEMAPKSGVSEPFYHVLNGHHRLEAAKRLGVKKVPVYLTPKEQE
tara:strand:+ start:28 stop:747 length:720 start_codon:yes stop_codon:yes gene_type:complete